MNIDGILEEYDAMFGAREPREILSWLMQKIDIAREERDVAAEIILLNEVIGFCRDAAFKEEGVRYARELENLMHELDFEGRIEYATTMLNLANAYRGFGMPEESEKRYAICEELYNAMLPKNDFLFAGLYNNRGLLYQELKEWERAVEDFQRAAAILNTSHPEHEIELASTKANLAAALIYASPEGREEAEQCLRDAIDIFERDGGTDFHYSAALSALGTLYFQKEDYLGAAACFRKAMEQLYAGTGASENYRRVKENYELSMRCAGEQREIAPDENDAFSRSGYFYEEYLLPRIEREIPDALSYIAVGYAGEGSEHFGFDDEYSRDHDYAPGCCVWLSAVHAEKYRKKLEALYRDAYQSAFGGEPDVKLGRQGVMEIDEFFERLTTIPQITMRYYAKGIEALLNDMDDETLAGVAAAVNGGIFHDGEGTITKLRRYFREEMPEGFRRKKLANLTHLFSQAGQYNYLRSLKRGDFVTAGLYEARAVQCMLQIAFYLNRRFPPYLKLLCRGTAELSVLPELSDIARAIADMPSGKDVVLENGTDNKALSFDIASALILDQMVQQGMIADYDKNEPFADRYIAEIAGLVKRKAKGGKQPEIREWKPEVLKREDIKKDAAGADEKTRLIEAVVALEWEQFDRTENEGGRADCQDNWETFSVMRKSQYMTWPEELLVSFFSDLSDAKAHGRNLITEKYGRMMESTAPERYKELEPYFPKLDEDRLRIQEEIIAIQIGWMEEFAKKYPKMADSARSIHTSEDTAYNTSYETYLRGEISTYSDGTLILYGRFIAGLAQAGRNLAAEIMGNTARLLGYKDLEDAEKRLEG
ncbi:MAG: DUF4125 family protein [Lachnospiraceae bacterium]|nr:DUF4125 family protein [Lachnospiraceae bacterium]